MGIDGNLIFAFPLKDELVEQHNIAYDGSLVLEGRGAVVFIGSGEYVHSDLDMEELVKVYPNILIDFLSCPGLLAPNRPS